MTSLSTHSRLTKIFETAPEIPFNSASKIVLIGDCHRGDGSWVDDFRHNQNLYCAAIKYYYYGGFTYIDMGDSEELWKNRKFSDISGIYTEIYHLLHDFDAAGRYRMIYGNHDIVKKNPAFMDANLRRYYNNHTRCFEPLFENPKAYEGLILKNSATKNKILLVHGHQGDLISDILWPVGRFLTRHVWRRLELVGHRDPTSAAKNVLERKKVERKILEWVTDKNQPVIAGHTHRPTCPPEDQPPYFNGGSCVHPNCITCLEIENAQITLVQWDICTKEDRTLYVARQTLSPPRKL